MKTLSTIIVTMLLTVTQAMASANGVQGEGLGLMAILFIGFGAMIIVFQTVPAILLFAGMAKGLLSPSDKKADAKVS